MGNDYFTGLRQGRVLDLSGRAELDGLYIIVSQSCDVVQPKRELIQLAPVIEIHDVETRRSALKRENPRFPLIFEGEGGLFADLAQIVSLEKIRVQGASERSDLAFVDSFAEREFGLAVGRWFSRFALPDEVQPWLAPVQDLIRSKHDSPASPLGKVLQQVAEVRVEATRWDKGPFDLTLHVIAKAGALPTVPEDADLAAVGALPSELNAICEAIEVERDAVRRSLLWSAFADALAARCKLKPKFQAIPEYRDAVASVAGELSTDDEFSLARVRRSEQLDVDFLSDPAPY
jgi:hypothetical protein